MTNVPGIYAGLSISALITFLGGGLLYKRVKLLRNGIRTEATIVDFIHDTTGSGQGNNYIPVINFETENKELVTHRFGFSVDKGAYEKGDKINITYDPGNPQKFTLMNFWSAILGPAILTLGIIGLLIFILRMNW
jgi:hypothetical protein